MSQGAIRNRWAELWEDLFLQNGVGRVALKSIMMINMTWTFLLHI